MLKRKHGDSFVLVDQDLNVIDWNPPDHTSARWVQLDVRSVQHTGTDFLHGILMDAGWNCRVTHWTKANAKDPGLLISPIRKPEDCWVTWCSRDRKEDFYEMWSLFNQVYLENHNLMIVPIDTEDRDEHLQRLSERLKCELKTDWSPKNSRPHQNYKERDFSDIYELPIVRRFYANLQT